MFIFIAAVFISVAILALATKKPVEEGFPGPTPPRGFSLSISQAGATIGKPFSGYNSETVSVTISPVDNYDKQVTLSYSPSLLGVEIVFTPENLIPENTSQMEIRVYPKAELRTSPITVRGEGADGVENTATFLLVIRT